MSWPPPKFGFGPPGSPPFGPPPPGSPPGPPPFGAPPFGVPPFGSPPFGSPPFMPEPAMPFMRSPFPGSPAMSPGHAEMSFGISFGGRGGGSARASPAPRDDFPHQGRPTVNGGPRDRPVLSPQTPTGRPGTPTTDQRRRPETPVSRPNGADTGGQQNAAPPAGAPLSKLPQGQVGPQRGGSQVFTISPGWTASVSSVARQPYNQGTCVGYKYAEYEERHMLSNERSRQSGKKMLNLQNREPQIFMREQKETVTLTIRFHHARDMTTKGEALLATTVDRTDTVKLPSDKDDVVKYLIKVFDQAGSTRPDQETTVEFVRKVDLDPLGLGNIQGDVIPGLPKALEFFYYFQITNVDGFRTAFKDFVLPKIVTSASLVQNPPPSPRDNRDHPFRGLAIGFSSLGIRKFRLNPTELGDRAFARGQMADSQALGDAGAEREGFWSPNWDSEYKANIDGIFLITAYNESNARKFIDELEEAFRWAPNRSSLRKIVALYGHPRPEPEAINDPFGWRGGGFTNPQVEGVTFSEEKPMAYTGTPVIPLGVLVMGREGDEDKDRRPEWAKDGSLIATRKLNCLVPELESYLLEEGQKIFPNLSSADAAAKLGARLMGRWKNGTPVVLSPDNDAPEIAGDPARVNNFEFDKTDTNQKRCPFAAHMRKSNPRNDIDPNELKKHLIRRHNMPYGPEVSDEERENGTSEDRGLHLCAYQSSIERGFRYIQCEWYNNVNFPPGKPTTPGWDPIFGQTGQEDEGVYRQMSGVNPAQPKQVTSFMEKFVDPRGGEYFFVPSMATLRQHIAAADPVFTAISCQVAAQG